MSSVRLLYVLTAFLAISLPAAANKPRSQEVSFIYLRGGSDSATMSGNLDDLERVKKALKTKDRVLWFRTADAREHVIRDAATLDQFEATWKPANELAARLGDIGGKQGVIGAKQGSLGMKQGALGMRVGALSTTQAALEQREEDAASEAQRQAIVKRRQAIEVRLRELEAKMADLDVQMRELEKPMRALDAQMAVIEKQHGAAMKQAHDQMEALLARAITSGIAKPF